MITGALIFGAISCGWEKTSHSGSPVSMYLISEYHTRSLRVLTITGPFRMKTM